MGGDGLTGAVVVGIWRRRVAGGWDSIRLVRDGTRWWVRRRCGPSLEVVEHRNRALAESAVAAVVGDAWVYVPPPRRYRGTVAR